VRNLQPAEVAIIEEKYQESYWTITAWFGTGEVRSVAGTRLTVNGHLFDGGLLGTSGLKASLGGSVDRIDVTVNNTDWRWTRLAQSMTTIPVRTEVGRVMRQIRSTSWIYLPLLSGIVVSILSNETSATVQCISDLYAAPAVGALRAVTRPCGFKFKDPRTCGFSGATPTTCNKIFESADGCLGRNNQHRYGGFIYDTGKDTLYLPPPDPNSNPYPGGGGIGGDGEPYYKYDNPYQLGY
jgi:hypothetical protein